MFSETNLKATLATTFGLIFTISEILMYKAGAGTLNIEFIESWAGIIKILAFFCFVFWLFLWAEAKFGRGYRK